MSDIVCIRQLGARMFRPVTAIKTAKLNYNDTDKFFFSPLAVAIIPPYYVTLQDQTDFL